MNVRAEDKMHGGMEIYFRGKMFIVYSHAPFLFKMRSM